jgi:hypothetical protein
MLLYGDSGMGKTMLIEKMERQHPNAALDLAPGIVGIAGDEAIHARAYVSAR